jgi:hypothetical protein
LLHDIFRMLIHAQRATELFAWSLEWSQRLLDCCVDWRSVSTALVFGVG